MSGNATYQALEKLVPKNLSLPSPCQPFAWPGCYSRYYLVLTETARGGTLIAWKTMWHCPFLAGLLLVTAGMSVPVPSRNSSLTFPPASRKARSEVRGQRLQQTTTEPG